ncbi:hypothetical protein V8G54_019933 [Vigna mungo]|uniref:Uncharacterized protein n=1 Tax=Vigna mungo TaxID=3915 RepID=A0AAQ3RU80_VIGMU
MQLTIFFPKYSMKRILSPHLYNPTILILHSLKYKLCACDTHIKNHTVRFLYSGNQNRSLSSHTTLNTAEYDSICMYFINTVMYQKKKIQVSPPKEASLPPLEQRSSLYPKSTKYLIPLSPYSVYYLYPISLLTNYNILLS